MEVFIQRKLERSSFTIPPALSISVLPEAQRQLPDSLTGDRARRKKMRFDLGDSEQIRNEKLIPSPLSENDRQIKYFQVVQRLFLLYGSGLG